MLLPLSTGPTIMRCTLLMPNTPHRAWLGMFCHIQLRTALHVFGPKYSWQTCPSNELMIAISLPPSDHSMAEFQWTQNDKTKCCCFTKTSIFCSQLIKCDDNTQEHKESAGANKCTILFWRKPKIKQYQDIQFY